MRFSSPSAEQATPSELGKNSVGQKQIEADAVRKAEIQKGAVRSDEVQDGALLASDFAAGQLPAGAQGIPGPQGEKGEKGDPGGQGLQGEKGDKGDRGDKGDKGDQGAQGVQGQQGPAGSARAYGYVDVLTCASQPSCTVRKAKGITQAIRIGVGHYCVSAPGLHPNTDIAMATLDWYGTSGPEGNTSVETTPHACSFTHIDPNAFVVRTERQPVSNGVSGQAVDAATSRSTS